MIASEGSKTQKKPHSTFFKKGQNRAILIEQEKEEYRKNGKCFNCGKQGHRSFECPDKKDKGKIRVIEDTQTEEKEDPKGKLQQLLKEMSKDDILTILNDSDNEDF